MQKFSSAKVGEYIQIAKKIIKKKIKFVFFLRKSKKISEE